MHRPLFRRDAPGAAAVLAVLATVPLAAQQVHPDHEWCRERHDGNGEHACEVREWTLEATERLAVDARPNGSVDVRAWDGDDVRVLARVAARARRSARAAELVSATEIRTSEGEVATRLPDTDGWESASVRYRVWVPRAIDLRLESSNGGIDVTGVAGDLDLHTTNGGIHLDGVAGTVEAHTTNGGIHVALAGDRWTGTGLEAATTNGGIELTVPDGFAADLSASTANGGIHVDFPVTVQGKIGRELSTELNGGGPPVHLRTTNGGIEIRRRG